MENGEDRLSHLPNELLESILCLMPLKYAIRTSTLSKRWVHLWKFNLISSTSFQFGKDFSRGQSPEQFSATLDRYLQLHGNRKLNKFGITFPSFLAVHHNFGNWIRTVLAKGIKELDINTYTDDSMPFRIPNSLFDSNFLTHLSLSRCNFSHKFCLANFAGLNSLSFDSVNITDRTLRNILKTCVSLESISLKRCKFLEKVKFAGDKLKLRKLLMVECLHVSNSYIEISASELESFVFHGPIWYDHYMENVQNVTDAYLCFAKNENSEEEIFVSNVLSEISHVKVLTMSSFNLIAIVAEEQSIHDDENNYFPIELGKLQELQLILNTINELHLNCLFSFFRICPSPFLEKLFIQCPSNLDEQDDLRDLVTEPDLPDVVFQKLKWIKITGFENSPLKLKLVKFLLKKAVVLESIFLVMNQCDKSNKRLLRKILQDQLSILPKASIDVRIVICGPSDHDFTMNPTHRTYYHQVSELNDSAS